MELTKNVVRQLLKGEIWDLRAFKSIDDEASAELGRDTAVKILSRRGGELDLSGLTHLHCHAARVLSLFRGSLSLNGLTEISVDVAGILMQHRGDLHLDGISKIDTPVATALSKHPGDLFLNGLSSLEEDVARALSKTVCKLFLNGVTELSVSATVALGKHKGPGLSLNGLKSLTSSQAGALAKRSAQLHMNGLIDIDEEVAAALSHIQGDLFLDGLAVLTDGIANALSTNPSSMLSLNGLKEITSDISAATIARHKGSLSLNGLRSINASVAKALSTNEGRLYVNGLERLSDEAAESLANHKGQMLSVRNLRLSNVALLKAFSRRRNDGALGGTLLAEEAKESLSSYERAQRCLDQDLKSGSVSALGSRELNIKAALKYINGELTRLDGYTEISSAAAKILGKDEHSSHLNLDGISHLKDSVAADLSARKGGLSLNGLVEICHETASCLARHKGDLSLNGLTRLGVAEALALSAHKGVLSLDGLGDISEAAAATLATHKGGGAFGDDNLSLDGLKEIKSSRIAVSLSTVAGRLSLNGLTRLTEPHAEIFSRHSGTLLLNGMKKLSDKSAEALAEHDGALHFDSLTEVSDRVASALGRHKHWHSLKGLKQLKDSAARALADHTLWVNGQHDEFLTLGHKVAMVLASSEFDLHLNGLECLSLKAANGLANHRGRALRLNGITKLPVEVANALGSHKGNIHLNGLTGLETESAEALAAHKGGIQLNGLVSLACELAVALSNHAGNLALDGLRELTPQIADGLVGHEGVLQLNGLTHLDKESAVLLSAHRGDLVLNRLIRLDDHVAKVFSRFNYALYLNGLVDLSNQAAEALEQHRGYLSLNGVARLGSKGANALARRRNQTSLSGLRFLGRSSRIALKKSPLVLFDSSKIKIGFSDAVLSQPRPLERFRDRDDLPPVTTRRTLSMRAYAQDVADPSNIHGYQQEICNCVFAGISRGTPGPVSALLRDWLLFEIHDGNPAEKESVCCMQILHSRIYRHSWNNLDTEAQAFNEISLERLQSPIEFNDGNHLYRTLDAIAANACHTSRERGTEKVVDKEELDHQGKSTTKYIKIFKCFADFGEASPEDWAAGITDENESQSRAAFSRDVIARLIKKAKKPAGKDRASQIWAYYVSQIDLGYKPTQQELARTFQVNQSTVQRILLKKEHELRQAFETAISS